MLILASPAGGPIGSFTDEFADVSLNSRWTQTNGSWSIISGDVKTSTAASSYPLLTFNAGKKEVTLRAEGSTTNTFGWGVAFWVVDANNWWAVETYRTSYTCQIGTTSGCCACGNMGISQNNPPSCDCVFPPCETHPDVIFCGQTISAGTCTYPVYATCYNYQIDLIECVSGVKTLRGNANIYNGNVGSTGTISYVQVVTNAANNIVATGVMNTGQSQTINYTAPSPNKGNRHGVIITPSKGGTQENGFERFVYTLS